MEWQWHQVNHMQIICTSLQADNHTSTSSLNFLQAGCWSPTQQCQSNSVNQKLNKATETCFQLLCVDIYSSFLCVKCWHCMRSTTTAIDNKYTATYLDSQTCMLFPAAYIYQQNSIHMVTVPLYWSISQPITCTKRAIKICSAVSNLQCNKIRPCKY